MTTSENRNECIICGEQRKAILDYGNFPVAPRATLRHHTETFDFIVGVCETCELIQLMNLADPSILYEEFKNDIVGQKLSKHKEAYKEFLLQFVGECDRLFEVGAGGGGLANLLRKSIDPKVEITVNDINIQPQNLVEKISFVEGCFEDADIEDDQYSIVYSSHVFEHILNYDAHLQKVRRILCKDGKLVISLPNFEFWIRQKYLNAFTQEHTVYPFRADICNLLSNYGFELVTTQEYLDHSLFLCFSYTGEVASKSTLSNTEKKSELITEYVDYLGKLKQYLRCESEGYKLHIFGANSSCQVILNLLGDDYASTVKSIYDNSKLKQGNYIFGHTIKIVNPEDIMALTSKDIILVFVGAFDDEIKNQVFSLNKEVKVISREDFDVFLQING